MPLRLWGGSKMAHQKGTMAFGKKTWFKNGNPKPIYNLDNEPFEKL